jgi:cellulose synthase/poly-beta-1,6-N-acetylglucosamine synthase-like glycosyltransferase
MNTLNPARGQVHDQHHRTVAVIPAHNEEQEIGATLTALMQQVAASNIVVAADNCTDATVEIARGMGVTVIETVGNTDKKAGALNQIVSRILPDLSDDDSILVLDADTTMAPNFVATARRSLAADPNRGAVGGIFTGRDAKGWLEIAQANEYARYAREVERIRRVMVLTGTASLIRVAALRDVAQARGTLVPGVRGDIYDRTALTEDMELTLALTTLGWSLASPAACLTTTQLMPDVKALVQQRVRWYRGALDNVRTYGWTPVTKRYIGQQVMLAIGAFAMALYVTVMVVDAGLGLLGISPFWLSVGLLFAIERVVTAWRAGVKGRLLAAAILPELGYDLILQYAFAKAAVQWMRRTEGQWHHNTDRPAPAETTGVSAAA